MSFSYFSNLPRIYRVPLKIIGLAILGTLFFIVIGYAVMLLWNHVLAAVWDIPSVTFWQALGLFVLAKLFFGFGGGGGAGARGPEAHKKHRRRRGAETTDEPPETDGVFQQYWRDEGKQAYEAYLASKERTGASNDGT